MSLQHVSSELLGALHSMQLYLPDVLIAFAVIWGVNLVNWLLLGSRLNAFGVYPRHIAGLPGIIFSPILHGNFSHLLFNTIPGFVLACFVLIHGLDVLIAVTAMTWVGSGLLVWLFGRQALHVGMSAVITGYFGYLLVEAFRSPSLLSILLAVIMLYYFGGIFLGIFPQEEKVSWEGHLFGLICGIAANFFLLDAFYYYFLLMN